MAGQVIFFQKNIIDIDNDEVTMTVTDAVASNNGQDFINFVRNRRNDSAWMTTESDDTANTEIIMEWISGRDVSEIILVKHNWKAFTIKYWNGSSYVDFSTPIAETNNTQATSRFSFDLIEITRVQIIIQSTQVANADKELFQLIVTQYLLTGQLNGWPMIKNPTHSTNKKVVRMLSGKASIAESLGFFKTQLSVSSWRDDDDLSLIEKMYTGRQAFLVWLCGGDELQFSTKRIGYRLEDFYLMRPTNEYEPEWNKGLYKSGVVISMNLEEVVR